MKVDWLDSPAILGLLKAMPKTSRAGFVSWPREQRERWLAAFTAVLDMEYPSQQDRAEDKAMPSRPE